MWGSDTTPWFQAIYSSEFLRIGSKPAQIGCSFRLANLDAGQTKKIATNPIDLRTITIVQYKSNDFN
jgi:hypothetical protein